jgi:lipopolysaccharide transport system permease protein
MKWFPDPQHPIHFDPNWRMVILPILLLQITLLGVGAGLIIAALTTRYRDLQMGVGFMVQLWMFCSSVVIPLSELDEKYQAILKFNPMVPVIEGFRFAFLGKGTVTQVDLLVAFAMSAIIFLVGLIMFSRTEQTVMDTV